MTRAGRRPSGDLRLLLVAIGFVAVVMGGATAFVLDGDSWPHPAGGAVPMTETWALCANTTDVDAFSSAAAVIAAAQTWNQAGARFRFTSGGLACNHAPALDGVNQVRWGSVPPYPAATYVWSTTGGVIYEVDTILDDVYAWSTSTPTPQGKLDIQTIMLHEFGHWLSLGHSSPPAVMQPSIDYGVQRRILTPDDTKGIVQIYGCG